MQDFAHVLWKECCVISHILLYALDLNVRSVRELGLKFGLQDVLSGVPEEHLLLGIRCVGKAKVTE
jgi:hypothetical protein